VITIPPDKIRTLAQEWFDNASEPNIFRLLIDDENTERWQNGYVFIPFINWVDENKRELLAGSAVIYCSDSGEIVVIPSYAAGNYREYLSSIGILK
jgi:hypothetical protein